MILRRVCPALFLVGVALLIPFEMPITLVVGVVALFGFIVSGVFLVATPDFIDADDDGG